MAQHQTLAHINEYKIRFMFFNIQCKAHECKTPLFTVHTYSGCNAQICASAWEHVATGLNSMRSNVETSVFTAGLSYILILGKMNKIPLKFRNI